MESRGHILQILGSTIGMIAGFDVNKAFSNHQEVGTVTLSTDNDLLQSLLLIVAVHPRTRKSIDGMLHLFIAAPLHTRKRADVSQRLEENILLRQFLPHQKQEQNIWVMLIPADTRRHQLWGTRHPLSNSLAGMKASPTARIADHIPWGYHLKQVRYAPSAAIVLLMNLMIPGTRQPGRSERRGAPSTILEGDEGNRHSPTRTLINRLRHATGTEPIFPEEEVRSGYDGRSRYGGTRAHSRDDHDRRHVDDCGHEHADDHDHSLAGDHDHRHTDGHDHTHTQMITIIDIPVTMSTTTLNTI